MQSILSLSLYAAAALVSGAHGSVLPREISSRDIIVSRNVLESRATIRANARMSISNDWPTSIHVAVTDNKHMSDEFPGSSNLAAFGATSDTTIKASVKLIPLQSSFKVQFDSLATKAVLDVGIGKLQSDTYANLQSGAPGQIGVMQAPGEPLSDTNWNFFFFSGPGIVPPLVNSLIDANMAAVQAYIAKNPVKPTLVNGLGLEINSIPNNVKCTYAAMKPSGTDKQYTMNAIMNINGRVGGKLTVKVLGTQPFTMDLTDLSVLVQATLDMSNLASPKITIKNLQFSLKKVDLSSSASKAVEIIFPVIFAAIRAPVTVAGFINTKYNGNILNFANSALTGVLPKFGKRAWMETGHPIDNSLGFNWPFFGTGTKGGGVTPVQTGHSPTNLPPPPACTPDPAKGISCQQHLGKRYYPKTYRVEDYPKVSTGIDFRNILKGLSRRGWGSPLEKRAVGPYSTWMSKPTIQSKQMKDLKIPGSHDSGTYALTKDLSLIKYGDIAFLWDFDYSTPAPADGNIPSKAPYHLGPVFGQYVLDRINHIARAQDQSIKDQLYGGIRYFDLRLYYDPSSKSFFSQHGLKGVNAEDIFGQVASFMSEQSTASELVMLDVSHTNFGNYPECIPLFQSLVVRQLGNLAYMPPSSIGVKNFNFQSLKDMKVSDITGGKNKVMVLNTDNSNSWYFPDNVVNTAGYADPPSTAGQPGLYRVSNVHTPVPDDVLGNILKAVCGQVEFLLQTLALQTNKDLPNYLSQQTGGYNVVFADWYEQVPAGTPAPVELVVGKN